VGIFVRAYEIDGECFELYAELVEVPAFQLVDADRLPVGDPFIDVPDDEMAQALVRATRKLEDGE